MMTRSSRCLFVVLLHLVGVAQWPNVLPFLLGLEEISFADLASSPEEYVWLQDVQDQLCLGPSGKFAECGDANLWQVGRTKRKRLRMGVFGIEDTSIDGWRFQVVDGDHRQRKGSECLRNKEGSVSVERCSNFFSIASSTWDVKGDGSIQSLRVLNAPLCLMRRNQSATLASCHDSRQQKVHFAFVRYRAVAVAVQAAHFVQSSSTQYRSKDTVLDDLLVTSTGLSFHSNTEMPYASAQSDAHATRLLQPSASHNPVADVTPKKRRSVSLKALHETNPILFLGAKSQTSTLLVSKASSTADKSQGWSSKASHSPALQARRRIEVHPYIAAAKNEIWVDPQTGLEYRTDLCQYLGLDRKAHGRVTLMGVGQYRKGYVVKVYGVAFYVSKRDALADSSLLPFAGLSAEELRSRPDFYALLRSMNPAAVDRTLLLKTNMQLSAEVMRSSLHADWQYLTPEAKTTLIDSSMREREADFEMLRIIQSPENPSRCSCSQVAPEEYRADPSCCARGTELAFTWLKTGELEVRLNGRLMDRFPRADIAEGIFFEYLRYDDPISPELRERVVDGFPFLLAPLAQVKGVSIGQQRPNSRQQVQQHVGATIRAVVGLAESLSSSVFDFVAEIQREAINSMDHAAAMARSMADSGASARRELVEKKDWMIRQVVAFPDTVTSMWASRRCGDHCDAGNNEVSNELLDQEVQPRRESLGRAFGYPLSRWFSESYHAPDEIGPMKITPSLNATRKAFLAFVHFYLLLLFIVSFPGSYTTRTKLIVRRPKLPSFVRNSSASDSVTLSSDEKSDSSLDSRGSPRAAASDLTRGGAKRVKCRSRRLTKRGMDRRALGPSVSEDIRDELSCGSSNIRLKKKSLSYFL